MTIKHFVGVGHLGEAGGGGGAAQIRREVGPEGRRLPEGRTFGLVALNKFHQGLDQGLTLCPNPMTIRGKFHDNTTPSP